MPITRKYGPKDKNEFGNKFRSLTQAYDSYQKDRFADKTNPAIAPKNRFAEIWGWTEKKKR